MSILENPAASFSFADIQDGGVKMALEEIRRLIVTHENQQLAYSAATPLGSLSYWLIQMSV